MTSKIKSAIEHLDVLIGMVEDNQNTDYDSDFRLAIRSLKAWEEVITELENFDESKYFIDDGLRFGCNEGICYALELINQKLEQIEE